MIRRLLAPREHDAALRFVARVRREVPAELVRALLFGSRARGEGRPDSDLDVLLVFRCLAPDREPHATWAEEIAEEVAEETGVPVTTWCVSLADLRRGRRTPMLVDALDDGVPLWPPGAPPLRAEYTPEDALFCAAALLDRVEEGSGEFASALGVGDAEGAARRARDDVVR
ncbi:MAG TPA: nucleotidyltransferase domain-containing protein, partial [Longimicrobium sp.]|nr:nucleotidyltransferase domain-containing protein [Longimicrobium sp.]